MFQVAVRQDGAISPKWVECINEKGNRYGRLYVVEFSHMHFYHGARSPRAFWIVRCDCSGKVFTVNGSSLRSGVTKSCGCIRNEKSDERIKRFNAMQTYLTQPRKSGRFVSRSSQQKGR
jgi:hypothetical protein